MTLTYTDHVLEQLSDRDLLISDLLYVLKNGFVYAEAQPSTKQTLFKYRMESQSPNSGNRELRVVVIPDPSRCWLKIVTIMWVD